MRRTQVWVTDESILVGRSWSGIFGDCLLRIRGGAGRNLGCSFVLVILYDIFHQPHRSVYKQDCMQGNQLTSLQIGIDMTVERHADHLRLHWQVAGLGGATMHRMTGTRHCWG